MLPQVARASLPSARSKRPRSPVSRWAQTLSGTAQPRQGSRLCGLLCPSLLSPRLRTAGHAHDDLICRRAAPSLPHSSYTGESTASATAVAQRPHQQVHRLRLRRRVQGAAGVGVAACVCTWRSALLAAQEGALDLGGVQGARAAGARPAALPLPLLPLAPGQGEAAGAARAAASSKHRGGSCPCASSPPPCTYPTAPPPLLAVVRSPHPERVLDQPSQSDEEASGSKLDPAARARRDVREGCEEKGRGR